jgi:hypothetical protein
MKTESKREEKSLQTFLHFSLPFIVVVLYTGATILFSFNCKRPNVMKVTVAAADMKTHT